MDEIKIRRCIGCMRTGIDMLGIEDPICGDCWGLYCQYDSEHDDNDVSEEALTTQLKVYAQRAINEKRIARRAMSAASVAHIPDPLATEDILS